MDFKHPKVGDACYFFAGRQTYEEGYVTVTRVGKHWSVLSNGLRL